MGERRREKGELKSKKRDKWAILREWGRDNMIEREERERERERDKIKLRKVKDKI